MHTHSAIACWSCMHPTHTAMLKMIPRACDEMGYRKLKHQLMACTGSSIMNNKLCTSSLQLDFWLQSKEHKKRGRNKRALAEAQENQDTSAPGAQRPKSTRAANAATKAEQKAAAKAAAKSTAKKSKKKENKPMEA